MDRLATVAGVAGRVGRQRDAGGHQDQCGQGDATGHAESPRWAAGSARAARPLRATPSVRDQSPQVCGHCRNSVGLPRNVGVRHRGLIAHAASPRPRESSKGCRRPSSRSPSCAAGRAGLVGLRPWQSAASPALLSGHCRKPASLQRIRRRSFFEPIALTRCTLTSPAPLARFTPSPESCWPC